MKKPNPTESLPAITDRMELPLVTLEEKDGATHMTTTPSEAARLGEALGTSSSLLFERFAEQLANMGLGKSPERSLNTGVTLMDRLVVEDEAQAMVAMQMIQTYDLAMVELRRVRRSETSLAADSAMNRAAKLMRLFTSLLETLRKMQGKAGVQKVIVRHQHVEVHNEGGQSLISANQGGGGAEES